MLSKWSSLLGLLLLFLVGCQQVTPELDVKLVAYPASFPYYWSAPPFIMICNQSDSATVSLEGYSIVKGANRENVFTISDQMVWPNDCVYVNLDGRDRADAHWGAIDIPVSLRSDGNLLSLDTTLEIRNRNDLKALAVRLLKGNSLLDVQPIGELLINGKRIEKTTSSKAEIVISSEDLNNKGEFKIELNLYQKIGDIQPYISLYFNDAEVGYGKYFTGSELQADGRLSAPFNLGSPPGDFFLINRTGKTIAHLKHRRSELDSILSKIKEPKKNAEVQSIDHINLKFEYETYLLFNYYNRDVENAEREDYRYSSEYPHIVSKVLFETDSSVHSVWTSLHGNSSRSYSQKSFKLEFIDDVDSIPIILRNAGQDNIKGHIRNYLAFGMANKIFNERFDIRPVTLYINSFYYGLYYQQAPVNAKAMAIKNAIDKDQIDFLESGYSYAVNGSSAEMLDLIELVEEKGVNAILAIEKEVDIPSLFKTVILNTYIGNADWPATNTRVWKSDARNGKWQYELNDMDVSFGLDRSHSFNTNDLLRFQESATHPALLFNTLMRDSSYKESFILQYRDVLERMNPVQLLDSLYDSLKQPMQAHCTQVDANVLKYDDWKAEIKYIRNYLERRDYYARKQLLLFERGKQHSDHTHQH